MITKGMVEGLEEWWRANFTGYGAQNQEDSNMISHKNKEENYYGLARHAIEPLLPEKIGRILDVGCGFGDTLAWIKQRKGCQWAGGVEIIPEVAEKAKGKIDVIYQGNIECMDLPVKPETLDVILCLCVLEHTADPWAVLQRLCTLLRHKGILIAAIPNVRSFRVVLPLLFRGRWDYTEQGILDKDHLRFFTRKTAILLIESTGLTVTKTLAPTLARFKGKIADILTLGLLREFIAAQYIIRADKL